jgi:hypothetical protein
MSGKKAFVALAFTTALSILGAASAAAGGSENRDFDRRRGYVVPCSLVGVNPAYHPEVFGNPAAARSIYGFVQARDGTWSVIPNCHRY